MRYGYNFFKELIEFNIDNYLPVFLDQDNYQFRVYRTRNEGTYLLHDERLNKCYEFYAEQPVETTDHLQKIIRTYLVAYPDNVKIL